MNELKFFVMYWDSDRTVTGPMSFKKAIQVQNNSLTPCEILKKVIDIHGKEVK